MWGILYDTFCFILFLGHGGDPQDIPFSVDVELKDLKIALELEGSCKNMDLYLMLCFERAPGWLSGPNCDVREWTLCPIFWSIPSYLLTHQSEVYLICIGHQ